LPTYNLEVTMLELVVAVCLIDNPAQCKDIHLALDAQNVSQRQCVMRGQFQMAQWIGENPDWVIRRWTCGPVGQIAKLQLTP
jgi:hypothetical protein